MEDQDVQEFSKTEIKSLAIAFVLIMLKLIATAFVASAIFCQIVRAKKINSKT